jgi:uncharacterized membrane protein YuzA (DUF378 family)
MLTLLIIYFAINLFLSGIAYWECIQDFEGWYFTLGFVLLYILIGLPLVLFVSMFYMICNYFHKKKFK